MFPQPSRWPCKLPRQKENSQKQTNKLNVSITRDLEGWSVLGSGGERTKEKDIKFPGCQIVEQKILGGHKRR